MAPRPGRVLFVALTLLSAQLLALPAASAATVFEVEVGRFLDPHDNSRESLRFYPAALKVHQGDVVHFSTQSFHGVSLLPAGQDEAEWLGTYAGGLNRPFSLFQSDPDDGTDAYKINLSMLSPSAACGWPTQETCDFDGSEPNPITGVLHSGLPLFPTAGGPVTKALSFRVAINADPGQVIDVVDVLHPGMSMRIEVVSSAAPASDPNALAEESATLFAQDVTNAAALDQSYRAKRVKKKVGGKTTWTAWAGVETATVALRRTYPAKLTIKPGDRVKWLFSNNFYSAHTVTFPSARGRAIAGTFPVKACDPDGDFPDVDGGADPRPDTPPTSASPPYCDANDELELEAPDKMRGSAGDGKVASASDFESSGVRGRGIATSNSAYVLTFKKAGKGYSYVDMISYLTGVVATGKIVVKAR